MTITNFSIRRFLWKIRRLYYEKRYGMKFGFNGTMLPQFGKGRFVDVLKKGNYIELISHNKRPRADQGMIRLIPFQPNHGVMVEYHTPDGRLQWRIHCDYDKFYQMGSNLGEKKA